MYDLLDKQTYFKNPDHLKQIKTELKEKSPIRKAKQVVDKEQASLSKKAQSPFKGPNMGHLTEDMYLTRFMHN